ncbi:hypothetical protein M3J09_001964 [Ascochyta lentis]
MASALAVGNPAALLHRYQISLLSPGFQKGVAGTTQKLSSPFLSGGSPQVPGSSDSPLGHPLNRHGERPFVYQRKVRIGSERVSGRSQSRRRAHAISLQTQQRRTHIFRLHGVWVADLLAFS